MLLDEGELAEESFDAEAVEEAVEEDFDDGDGTFNFEDGDGAFNFCLVENSNFRDQWHFSQKNLFSIG